MRRSRRMWPCWNFSPLLIGDQLVTARQRRDRRALHKPFQSPPHRGSISNGLSTTTLPGVPPPFQSPPHRGSISNTPPSTPWPESKPLFQSPPHRGSISNVTEYLEAETVIHISVPSSSGIN